MARPKKRAVFVPPAGLRDIKCKFINFGSRHRSKVLRLLATEVREGKMSVHQWAEMFGQADTWMEQWADGTLEAWRLGTKPAPAVDKAGNIEVVFEYPDDGQTSDDTFTCTLTSTPISRLSHRVSIGGPPWWDSGSRDDRDDFRKMMHRHLDIYLDQYFATALRLGASREMKLPTNLDIKLEVAALYILCVVSRKNLAEAVHQAEATVYDWLTEAVELLQLRTRVPGHQTKRSSLLG